MAKDKDKKIVELENQLKDLQSKFDIKANINNWQTTKVRKLDKNIKTQKDEHKEALTAKETELKGLHDEALEKALTDKTTELKDLHDKALEKSLTDKTIELKDLHDKALEKALTDKATDLKGLHNKALEKALTDKTTELKGLHDKALEKALTDKTTELEGSRNTDLTDKITELKGLHNKATKLIVKNMIDHANDCINEEAACMDWDAFQWICSAPQSEFCKAIHVGTGSEDLILEIAGLTPTSDNIG